MKPNLIRGNGMPYTNWQHSQYLAEAEFISPETLLNAVHRVVLVSPHPDDETLANGGLLHHLKEKEIPVMLISVTNGNACYPGSQRWDPKQLGDLRLQEVENALTRLGWERKHYNWHHLNLPDTQVMAHEQDLYDFMVNLLTPDDLVFTTWSNDGHNDHDATGRAITAAAETRGSRCHEVPIWAWHWAQIDDERIPWDRLKKIGLSKAQQTAKYEALMAFETQLAGDPKAGIAPILSKNTLARFQSPFEILLL